MKHFLSLFSMTRMAVIALGAAALSQCAPYPGNGGAAGGSPYLADYNNPATQNTNRNNQPQGYWDGDGVVGPAKIRIVRSEQKAYFYKGST
ncbi:MAG: hypothetical protein ACPG32_07335, partial [Akkermansiaceae bacterium]